MAKAGYPDGFDMDLVYNLSASTHADSAIFIKDSFSKILKVIIQKILLQKHSIVIFNKVIEVVFILIIK